MNRTNNFNWLLFNLFLVMVFFFLSALRSAQAGTYNFYFNNTEQGDNSTATPNVTVKDGKEQATEKESESPRQATVEVNPAPALPTETSAQVEEQTQHPGLGNRVSLRVLSGAALANWNAHTTVVRPWDPFDSTTTFPESREEVYESERNRISPSLSGYIDFNSNFGVGMFLSKIAGIEAEMRALKSPLGSLELGFLAGLAVGPKDLTAAAPEIGARLTLFTRGNWGLALTARTDVPIDEKDHLNFQMFEAGLVFRL
jgi:hypothetical protein